MRSGSKAPWASECVPSARPPLHAYPGPTAGKAHGEWSQQTARLSPGCRGCLSQVDIEIQRAH
eukprot:14574445-Alexandrium_andersonii.AAC.1